MDDKESNLSGADAEVCIFVDGDRAPCIYEGYVWKSTSTEDPAVFIQVGADDPQGEIDITIDDNVFWFYTVEGDELMIEDTLYCENGECVYSFLPHQFPAVDTDNLSNYRVVAEVRDWEGNASATAVLLVGVNPSSSSEVVIDVEFSDE